MLLKVALLTALVGCCLAQNAYPGAEAVATTKNWQTGYEPAETQPPPPPAPAAEAKTPAPAAPAEAYPQEAATPAPAPAAPAEAYPQEATPAPPPAVPAEAYPQEATTPAPAAPAEAYPTEAPAPPPTEAQGYEQPVSAEPEDQSRNRIKGAKNRRFPLDSCYLNKDGFMCCSKDLEELMDQVYDTLVKSRNGKWKKCNIHQVAVAIQRAAQDRFNVDFEAISGAGDFASKINFSSDLVCKIKRDNAYILAYASPVPEV